MSYSLNQTGHSLEARMEVPLPPTAEARAVLFGQIAMAWSRMITEVQEVQRKAPTAWRPVEIVKAPVPVPEPRRRHRATKAGKVAVAKRPRGRPRKVAVVTEVTGTGDAVAA